MPLKSTARKRRHDFFVVVVFPPMATGETGLVRMVLSSVGCR